MTIEVKEDEAQPDTFVKTVNADGTVETQDHSMDDPNGYSALAAVQAALSQEPLDFENQIKLGLADRLQNAVEKRREEVAQSIFGNEEQEEPADDNNAGDEVPEEGTEVTPEEEKTPEE